MCGILGTIGDRWTEGFDDALASLGSRGPDDRGTWRRGPVLLGHTRLAILDLTACGHQPMTDGRHTLVFNGEIYNFRQLRDELERRGRRVEGTGDTAVLLAAWAEWGREVLPRLDGMYAFAVWDEQERRLFAARDRFGIKPLYYSTTGGFTFASTMRPFWHLRGFPRRVDLRALRDYLASQSIPTPRTILRDVTALPPAGWVELDEPSGRVEHGRHWQLPEARDQATAFDELVERCDDALRRSVRQQLVSDVPLGAFLSGGVDSSLMVAYMAEASSEPVRTFTVGFAGQGRYDEAAFAREVAERFGCVHHELDAQAIDSDQLEAGLRALDQPFADAAYLPTRALSQLTREHVTVAISGDGGDELFGGYPRFLLGDSARPPTGGHAVLRRLVLAGILPGSLLGKSLRGRERVLWDRVKLGPWPVSRKAMAPYLSDGARDAAHVEGTLERWRELLDRFGPTADADALMRADLWTYLSDDCLCKTDRASMAYGLEVRVPILGHDVVDVVLPEPASVKLEHGLKSILVELARRRLPRDVWDRPKHGFSVPVGDAFRDAWRDRCSAWIDRVETLAPFLDAETVRTQWHRTLAGRGERRVSYTIIALLGWLEAWPLDG